MKEIITELGFLGVFLNVLGLTCMVSAAVGSGISLKDSMIEKGLREEVITANTLSLILSVIGFFLSFLCRFELIKVHGKEVFFSNLGLVFLIIGYLLFVVSVITDIVKNRKKMLFVYVGCQCILSLIIALIITNIIK